ncbi:LytR/AlgR family response regulator transcription factor [Aquabacter cavernae]|uniref:LytR/AlgR family response regulator transcription factor n=1 Tax=Aquabacter cavernae TaxID=2496029 RepID=UPI000F8C4BFF|nr:LytTR family DNA-binding domain-containing protein [Aquabacter cavernae]
MLRVLVVDDEPLARRAIRRLLRAHPVDVVGEAETIAEATALIDTTHPDLVFLDIELNGGDGFDLLEALANPPKVVFVTAYAQHAVEAFAVDAVDYLLKPVAPERLAEALARVERQLAQRPDKSEDGVLELRTPSRSVFAKTGDIVALTADGDFTRVLLAGQPSLMIWRTLTSFEGLLPAPPFVRLSRSVIINLERLRRIDARSRDDVRLTMDGIADALSVGRAAAARLREAMGGQRL